jgi:DEAD/DEAH box helicase domain-containing protein
MDNCLNCNKMPVLHFLEENRDSTAMFVYPTKVQIFFAYYDLAKLNFFKALAQDQKQAFEQLLCACPGLEDVQV